MQQRLADFEIAHIGIPAAPITELYRVATYYETFKPDFVILQSGIVDCAPRALTRLELEFVKRLRMYRLVRPMSELLRKMRRISYTKLEQFEQTLEALKQHFSPGQLVAIGILPGCEAYEKAVPGITQQIRSYNEILSKHTRFISTDMYPSEAIANDFHHMTPTGHALLAETLLDAIGVST